MKKPPSGEDGSCRLAQAVRCYDGVVRRGLRSLDVVDGDLACAAVFGSVK